MSLAVLEYFVHLETEEEPGDLVAVTAEIPDSVSRIHLSESDLPSDWRRSTPPASTSRLGDQFIQKGKYAAMVVPSVIVPSEKNWAINPLHTEAKRIRIRSMESFHFDERMFR
jgi:RES domain-containing protein